MTTTVTLDLAGVNAGAANTPVNVMLCAVVNPDGTPIGTGGGGASPNVNLASFGGDPLVLGQMDADHSMSVVIASDQTPFQSMTDLVKIGGAALSLGQKAMAASVPVVLASNQSALPVTGTVGISGTVPVSMSAPVAVSGISGTVAVSAASALPVSGTVGISGTVPVSGSLGITGTVSDNLAQVGGTAITLGQKASAASLPVVMATEQLAALSAFGFVTGSTQTLAVTTTSANTVLGAAATGVLQIANPGPAVAFVAIGTNAQTATSASYPVLPGATVVINGASATNIAAVTLAGTATLYVSRGTGL